jgi:hypothetical protein
MKKLIIGLLVALLFASCEKENTSTTTAGTIISWVNNTSNPYKIEVDNKQITTINGGQYYDQSIAPGSYNYKITQLSGYILYPTVYAGPVTIEAGQKKVVSFP